MSFYYEVVSNEYDNIVGSWYFVVIQTILSELNFLLGDEIYIIDGSNGIFFRGTIKHITNMDNVYRLYCSNSFLDKLKGSGVRFVFDSVIPELSKELNKISKVNFICANNIYSVLSDGDFIELYGSNFGRMFIGKVTKISNDSRNKYTVDCYSLLNDLMRIYVRKIYYNVAVEDIVKDLIEIYMPTVRFEYISTGQVLEKFFANDYVYNIIKFLATGVGYVINFNNDILKFEPYGYNETGLVITKDFGKIMTVDKSINDIVNDVWIFGNNITISTSEKFVADGQSDSFTVKYSIAGSVKVLINGNEIDASQYTVDDYNGIITLDFVPNNGDEVEIDYDYEIPIVVHLSDYESIKKYGLRSKKFTVTSIKSFDVARNLAKQYIRIFKEPKLTVKVRIRLDKFLQNEIDVGQVVSVKLPEKDVDDKLIVKNISKKSNYVDLTLGRDDRDIISWYNDVETRLIELEKVELSKYLFSEYSYNVDECVVRVISNLVQSIDIDKECFEAFNVYDRICAMLYMDAIFQKFGEAIADIYSIFDKFGYRIVLNDNIINIKFKFDLIHICNIIFSDFVNININNNLNYDNLNYNMNDGLILSINISANTQEFKYNVLLNDIINGIRSNLCLIEINNINFNDILNTNINNNLNYDNLNYNMNDDLVPLIDVFGIIQEFGISIV